MAIQKCSNVANRIDDIHSNSRKGNPYDNAVMESFYRTIRRELIQRANYENPEQAQKEIFRYIEIYYNTKRMHSSLTSPIFNYLHCLLDRGSSFFP